MGDIHSATIDDCEQIATLLSDYFAKFNDYVGFPKYKTDYDLMLRTVKERISDVSSNFKYFVMTDGDNLLGFVNILTTKQVGELLILLLTEQNKNQENTDALVNFAVETLSDSGAPSIYTEVAEFETLTKQTLERHGAKLAYSAVVL